MGANISTFGYRTMQVKLHSSVEERLDRQEKLLTQILWNQTGPSDPQEASLSHETAATRARANVHTAPSHQQLPDEFLDGTPCNDCTCSCHMKWAFMASSWKNLAGALSVRSRGSPSVRQSLRCAMVQEAISPHAERIFLFAALASRSRNHLRVCEWAIHLFFAHSGADSV